MNFLATIGLLSSVRFVADTKRASSSLIVRSSVVGAVVRLVVTLKLLLCELTLSSWPIGFGLVGGKKVVGLCEVVLTTVVVVGDCALNAGNLLGLVV